MASRKQIAFDIDTNALKIYYPKENWRYAYEIIKRHMLDNGFKWLQGSVYVSEKPMSTVKVMNTLDNLVKKNPWLNLCMRDCRETNIGKEHDKNHLFNKNAKIPTREELNADIKQNTPSTMEDWKTQINNMKREEEISVDKNIKQSNMTRER